MGDGIDGACSTHEKFRNTYKIFVGGLEEMNCFDELDADESDFKVVV
jgi:hypothetical protein